MVMFDNPDQPNAVIILADDLGWKDAGYHGGEIQTPTLDAIADAGVRLDNFYVHPSCSPTRASLMTGQSPIRLGIQNPIDKNSTGSSPLSLKILPAYFKDAGYQTFMTGKWTVPASGN